MIDADGSETNPAPEYPCFEHPTLTDLLDAQALTWRYYALSAGTIWTGPDAIEHICQPQTVNGMLTCTGPDLDQNVVIPQTQVLTDIANGQLAQVSWVIPDGTSSDHAARSTTAADPPGSLRSSMQSATARIGRTPPSSSPGTIGAAGTITSPRQVINDGVSWGSGYVYGFRVPLIVVSPYAKAAYISHVTHDFGSILKFDRDQLSTCRRSATPTVRPTIYPIASI